jgi:hypothetical protein
MDNNKPVKPQSDLKKPHHYGKRDGVHLLHATDESHSALVGKHVHDPSEKDLNNAIAGAKQSGLSMVVIHGVPPESLRAMIHPDLGTLSPSQMNKSEKAPNGQKRSMDFEVIDPDDLHKAGTAAVQRSPEAMPSAPAENAPQATPHFKEHGYFEPALLARKKIATGHGEIDQPGAQRITPNALHHHLKTGSFTILTAQNPMGKEATPESNHAANKSLEADLQAHGAIYHHVKGKYGPNEEHSFMVHHTSSVSPHVLEGLGKKYQQESVIHSASGHHRLVHVNGENDGHHFKGAGYTRTPDATENFSLANDDGVNNPQKKFSLNINFDQMHRHAPKAPPQADEAVKKTEKIYFDDLQKAFLQPDQTTFTDAKAHAGAVSAMHPALMAWGAKNLSPLKRDAIESFQLDGKTIKIRKHDADLYSGWVEKDGSKLHSFEKVTLPELLVQLQSKLELYGKEDEVVKPAEPTDAFEALRTHAHKWFEENGHEIPHAEFDFDQKPEGVDLHTPDTKTRFKKLKAKIKQKQSEFDNVEQPEPTEFDQPDDKQPTASELNEAAEQVKEMHQDGTEVVQHKDLMPGLLNPEKQCEDCGSTAAFCDCYTGLQRPRLEFDGKKVTIFFKSEWAMEDRENFVEDLKRRAGQILKAKHKDKL